jgi:hypothetical protein
MSSLSRRFLPLAGATAVALFASSVRAQPSMQLGVRGSSLGYGPEVTVGLNRAIAVRAAYQTLDITRDYTDDKATYQLNPSFKGVQGFVDVHPFGGTFRLSGGLVSHTAELNLSGVAKASGTFSFNGVDYTTTQVGNVIGKVALPKQSPYAGFGWGPSLAGKGRVGMAFDVGVLKQDTPVTTLGVTGPLASDATIVGTTFRANVETERVKLAKDIGDQPFVQWFPVVSLTLRIRIK